MPRVLITSAGSTAAQNLARWLARATDFWTLGVDMSRDHAGRGLYSAEELVPSGRDGRYVPTLQALCRRFDIDLLVPVMEPELLACAGGRDALQARNTRLVCPPLECIQVCASKRALARRLEEAGIVVPRMVALRDAPLPVFVRPEGGTGSRRARVIRSEAERAVALAEPDLVASEYVEGPELSVDGFAHPEGRLVHAIQRTREDVRGGLAVRSTVVALGSLRTTMERLCEALGLTGFFNAQYRIDAEGRPAFFDVNPRLGGAMLLSFHAGLEAETYLRALVQGSEISRGGRERVGLRLQRRWENLIEEPS